MRLRRRKMSSSTEATARLAMEAQISLSAFRVRELSVHRFPLRSVAAL